MRKVRTSLVNSLSILFSCSLRAMYNRVNCTKKQHLMLKSYPPGINTWVFLNRYYNNILDGKLVNELHDLTEKHPQVILLPKVSDSLFVKIILNLVKKQNITLQISVRELHNDMILKITQGVSFDARIVDSKVHIVDMSLRKYMPKYIKPTSKINKITRGCETCISAMLLQPDLNKLRLSQLAKLDRLYIKYEPTGILKYLILISLNKRIKDFQIIRI